MRPRHVSVLTERVVEVLAPALARPGALAVDATLGLGGHTLALLTACPEARVIGIDRDPSALAAARQRIAEAGFADRLVAVHAVHDDIAAIVVAHAAGDGQDARVPPGVDPRADAVLFDLGVSSMQLDQPERGFAYAVDAPLDMRMDPGTALTAADVLNTYAERDLARVLADYGEERFARRIAATVVREREREPFRSSGRLVELIRTAIPAAARRAGGNPAKRTFQALRIEVNDELGAVRRAIPAALDVLAVGGRVAAITFHSLEDRIVKRAIAERTVSDSPADLPIDLPGHGPEFRWLVRGETPSASEMADNPRATSARLRAAERIAPARVGRRSAPGVGRR